MGRFQLGEEVFKEEWDAIYDVFALSQLFFVELQNGTDITIRFKIEYLKTQVVILSIVEGDL